VKEVLDGTRRGAVVHISNVPFSLRSFISGQAKYMRERGLDLHVICSAGELLDRFADSEGVTTHEVSIHRQITPFRDLAALWKIVRILRREQAVVVHAHTPKGGLLGVLGAWLARVPAALYFIHGLPFVTSRGFRRFALLASDRLTCAAATQVLCVSDSIRGVLLDNKLCRPEKAKVLLHGSCNGVDADNLFNPDRLDEEIRRETRARFGIGPDSLVLGFVGRIARDKGVGELVEAWRLLSAEFPNLHMVVVGPFEDNDPIPPEAAEILRTDPQIHLTGYVHAEHTEELPAIYDIMDVLAFPSYREGFGMVSIEAGAMRVPVVTTRIPGCVDAVVDGETGVLVPPRNSQSLANALRTYLCDPELRRLHGAASRQRVLRDFGQEAIWEAIYQEYRRLLQQAVEVTD